MAAEVAFLKHAANIAPDFVPKLLAESSNAQMIAMTLVQGEPFYKADDVSQSAITSAIEFYRQLNQDRDVVARYPVVARDCYRSISEHINHVKQRLLSLTTRHLPNYVRKSAQSALDSVWGSFERISRELELQISGGGVIDVVPIEFLRLSPGDFGFHNALRSRSGTVFIDFEYAGLDDPAKTLSDFFLQPKLPVCSSLLGHVANGFSSHGGADKLLTRAKALGAILSVKWKTIILAPLDPERFLAFQARYVVKAMQEMERRLEFVKQETFFE